MVARKSAMFYHGTVTLQSGKQPDFFNCEIIMLVVI